MNDHTLSLNSLYSSVDGSHFTLTRNDELVRFENTRTSFLPIRIKWELIETTVTTITIPIVAAIRRVQCDFAQTGYLTEMSLSIAMAGNSQHVDPCELLANHLCILQEKFVNAAISTKVWYKMARCSTGIIRTNVSITASNRRYTEVVEEHMRFLDKTIIDMIFPSSPIAMNGGVNTW